MPIIPIVISGLVSSLVGFVVSNVTQKPVIEINSAEVSENKKEEKIMSAIFYMACGYLATVLIKGNK